MTLSAGGRIGLAGAAVVGVAFGMARYAYGVTLPDIRADLGPSQLNPACCSPALWPPAAGPARRRPWAVSAGRWVR